MSVSALNHHSPCSGSDKNLYLSGVSPWKPVSSSLPGTSNSFHYLQNWPPEFTRKPQRFYTTHELTRGLTGDSLDYIIRDRLTTSYYGLQQYFKSNDPTGKGQISHDALHHILTILFGPISQQVFSRFLIRHGLNKKPYVEFEPFVSIFQDNKLVQQQWISPTSGKQLHKKKWGHIEPPEYPVFTTATQAIPRLREKVLRWGIRQFLPKSCLNKNSLIVAPQLREVMAHLCLRMTDMEFMKLWLRLDTRHIGAMKISRLYKILGLNPDGTLNNNNDNTSYPPFFQRSQSAAGPGLTTTTLPTRQEGVAAMPNASESHGDLKTSPDDSNKIQLRGKVKDLIRQKKTAVPFQFLDSILACILYKFDEGYNLLLSAFKLYDVLNDGLVSRIDVHTIFDEFGFPSGALEFDAFLKRNNFRILRSQVQYKEILNRFVNKTEGSSAYLYILSQLVNSGNSSGEVFADDKIERKVFQFLHSDFIKFMANLRNTEDKGNGTISESDLKNVITKMFDHHFAPDQWARLWSDVESNCHGLVSRTKLLDKLNIPPGLWNKRLDVGQWVAQVRPNDFDTQVLDGLREKACVDLKVKKQPPQLNQIEKLTIRIGEHMEKNQALITALFHETDGKNIGRVSLWQFYMLLQKTKMDIVYEDLRRLWGTLDISSDGLARFSYIIRHFIPKYQSDDTFTQKRSKKAVNEVVETEKPTETGSDLQKAEIEPPQPALEEQHFSPSAKVDVPTVDDVLERVRPAVLHNWDVLKQIYEKFDPNGYMSITVPQIESVFASRVWGLSIKDRELLYSRFVTQMGRFKYIKFMEAILKISSPDDHPNYSSKDRTVYDRYNTAINPRHPKGWKHKNIQPPENIAGAVNFLRDQLIAKYKTLLRGFKKLDVNKDGVLEVSELKKVLRDSNIVLPEDDFYNILAQFDSGMTGKISYCEFLNECINV